MIILEYNYFRERRKFPSPTLIKGCFKPLLDMSEEDISVEFLKLFFIQKTGSDIVHFKSLNDFKTPHDMEMALSLMTEMSFNQKPTEDLDWAFEAPVSYNFFRIRTSLGMNVRESMLIDQKVDKLIDCLEDCDRRFGMKSGNTSKAWRPINNLWAEDIGNNLIETIYEGVFFNVSNSEYAKLKHGNFFANESGSWSMKFMLD